MSDDSYLLSAHSAPGYIMVQHHGSHRALRIVQHQKNHHAPDYMVLHERGSKYFGGQSRPQNYAVAQFLVLRATETPGVWEKCVEFPVRWS